MAREGRWWRRVQKPWITAVLLTLFSLDVMTLPRESVVGAWLATKVWDGSWLAGTRAGAVMGWSRSSRKERVRLGAILRPEPGGFVAVDVEWGSSDALVAAMREGPLVVGHYERVRDLIGRWRIVREQRSERVWVGPVSAVAGGGTARVPDTWTAAGSERDALLGAMVRSRVINDAVVARLRTGDTVWSRAHVGGRVLNAAAFLNAAFLLVSLGWVPRVPADARAWRAARRRRRGLCGRCGYDLARTAAGSLCPECGEGRESEAGKRES